MTFGPRHRNAHAAARLIEVGGGRSVQNAGELFQVMSEWLGDKKLRAAAGESAGAYIDAHRGAAQRSSRLLLDLLAGRTR